MNSTMAFTVIVIIYALYLMVKEQSTIRDGRKPNALDKRVYPKAILKQRMAFFTQNIDNPIKNEIFSLS